MASRTPGSKLDVGMELNRRREEEEEEVKRKMRLVVVDADATDLAYVPLLGEDCQADGNSKDQAETQRHRTVTTELFLW